MQMSRTQSVVEAFYTGVNAWIATGDRSLEHLIAPDFVDHTASGAPDRSRSGTLRQLSAIGAALPSLNFEILEIEAGGTIVSVDLLGDSGTYSHDRRDGRSPFQRNNRSARSCGSMRIGSRNAGAPTISGRAARFRSSKRARSASMRISNHPFSASCWMRSRAFDFIATGTVIIWVESGELGIEMSGRDQTGAIRFPADSLVPGSFRMVEPEGELRVRALGVDRVVVWTVSLDKILIPIGVGNSNVLSVIHRDAKVSLELQLPTNAIELSLLIISLTPGSTLSTSAASLHAVAVVSGELQAQPHTGEVFYCFDGTRSRLLNGAETALSGEGFANQRGSSATYQVAGPEPATLVLFAILPADSPPPNSSALALAERSRRSLEDVSGLS